MCLTIMAGMLIVLLQERNAEELDPASALNIASTFQQDVLNLFKQLTHVDKIQHRYNQLYKNSNLSIYKLSGDTQEKHFTDNISKVLQTKTDGLRQMQKKAEELYKAYDYNKNIEPFHYNNIWDTTWDVKPYLELYPKFSLNHEINLTFSAAQVPANIYWHDSKVLNAAKWTEGLDAVFIENLRNMPHLQWQNFGSITGLVRTYPANKNQLPPGQVHDRYDCRRRVWYIQATSSPKDFVILLDVSGSMAGATFDIARIAVKMLINTFQEDDFFNVLYVSNEAKFLRPCKDGLVQATKKNKEDMTLMVDKIPSPRRTATWVDGFSKAFHILNNKAASYHRNCNKAIAVITDGIEETGDIEDLIDEKNSHGQIRIFSYLIGRKKNANESPLRRIACDNKGYFYQLPTIGSTWDVMPQYTDILSRPLAKVPELPLTFTPIYLDSSGLGMTMTVSVAVFNRKTNTSKEMLGVVGIDVAISILSDQVPKEYLGAGGYGFLINDNGLLLVHPRFKDQTGYLPDPPTVLLNEVEYSVNPNDSLRLTQAMMKRQTGNMTFEVYQFENKRLGRFLEKKNITYYFRPVPGTPFISGVAVNQENMVNINVNDHVFDSFRTAGVQALAATTENTEVRIFDWDYCNIPAAAAEWQPAVVKAYPTALEIKQYLEFASDVTETCKKDLIHQLILSAAIIDQELDGQTQLKLLQRSGLKMIIAMSTSGYIKIIHRDNTTHSTMDRNMYSYDFIQHALQYTSENETILTFTVPARTKQSLTAEVPSQHEDIFVSGAIQLRNTSYTVAVLSILIDSRTLNNMLLGVFEMSTCVANNTYSKNSDFKFGSMNGSESSNSTNTTSTPDTKAPNECVHSHNTTCLLLDENGYIVASNRKQPDIGQFLGNINGLLFHHFLQDDVSVFLRYEFHDTQADCYPPYKTSSSSASGGLSSVFRTTLACFGCMLNLLAKLIQNLSLTLTATFTTLPSIEATTVTNNVSCTKVVSIYTMNQNDTSGKIVHRNCEQEYIVRKVKYTNLALLVTRDLSDVPCPNLPLYSTEPVRMEEQDKCHVADLPRKNNEQCFIPDADDESDCSDESSSNHVYNSNSLQKLIFFNVMILLLLNYF